MTKGEHSPLYALRTTLYALRSTTSSLQSLYLIEMIEAHFFSFDTAFGSVFFKFVFKIFSSFFVSVVTEILRRNAGSHSQEENTDPGDDPHNSVVSKLVKVHTKQSDAVFGPDGLIKIITGKG